MPATERSFADPLPPSIYLDTDVLVAYIVDREPHHARSRAFMQRLLVERQTRTFISSLSWMEFVHAVMQRTFRERLSSDRQREFRLTRWHAEPVRRTYVSWFLQQFGDTVAGLQAVELPLTADIRAIAVEYAVRYNLGSQDAVHLASATYGGVVDVASFDARFRRVEGLALWNDGIHTTVP